MKHPYLQTGKIVSTHGVHGEVKLLPWADGPEFLLQFHTLYLDGRPYQVEQSRVQKTCVLLKLEGIDTVEAASALRNKIVSIARADAKLPEGSLFIADLLGLPVYDGETLLGTLAEVMPTPANDVYVVKSEDGQEHLIPSVPEVLRSGDHAKVARWQKKQAILRTLHRRPDLFYKLRFPYKTRAERKFIAELEAEDDAFRDRDPKNLDYRK